MRGRFPQYLIFVLTGAKVSIINDTTKLFQRKFAILRYFSILTSSKIGYIAKIKIKAVLFCILHDLHYLCTHKAIFTYYLYIRANCSIRNSL